MIETPLTLFQLCLNALWACRKNNTLDKESFILNIQKNDNSLTREDIELMLEQPLHILLEIPNGNYRVSNRVC